MLLFFVALGIVLAATFAIIYSCFDWRSPDWSFFGVLVAFIGIACSLSVVFLLPFDISTVRYVQMNCTESAVSNFGVPRPDNVKDWYLHIPRFNVLTVPIGAVTSLLH